MKFYRKRERKRHMYGLTSVWNLERLNSGMENRGGYQELGAGGIEEVLVKGHKFPLLR